MLEAVTQAGILDPHASGQGMGPWWLVKQQHSQLLAAMRGALTDQALHQVLMPFFSFDLYNKPVGGLGINWYDFGCNDEDIYCINKECRGPHLSFWGLYPNAAHSQSTLDHFFRLSSERGFLLQCSAFSSPVPFCPPPLCLCCYHHRHCKTPRPERQGPFSVLPSLPFGCHLGHNRYH